MISGSIVYGPGRKRNKNEEWKEVSGRAGREQWEGSGRAWREQCSVVC